MTLYTSIDYYFNKYKGNTLNKNGIEIYLKKAQEKIDSITHNRILSIGFENLTEFQKEKIQEAICSQADYIYENGYNHEDNEDISSYRVLDISVNVDNSNKQKTVANSLGMSEYAYDCTKKTGLTVNSWRY